MEPDITDINRLLRFGMTPRHIAAYYKMPLKELYKFIKENGVHPVLRTNYSRARSNYGRKEG